MDIPIKAKKVVSFLITKESTTDRDSQPTETPIRPTLAHDPEDPLQKQLRLSNPELPQWMKQGQLVRSGYRPQLNSFYACVRSLFWLHNESVNTWSHLLPAFLYAGLFVAVIIDSNRAHPSLPIRTADYLAIQVYIAGTAACLFLSASISNGKSVAEHRKLT